MTFVNRRNVARTNTRKPINYDHGEIKIIMSGDSSREQSLVVHKTRIGEFVNAIEFDPHSRYVACAESGGTVVVFDAHTFDKLATLPGAAHGQVLSLPLAWNFDGSTLSIGHGGNGIATFHVPERVADQRAECNHPAPPANRPPVAAPAVGAAH